MEKCRFFSTETAQPVAMIRFDVADRMMLYSLDCLVLCYQEQRTRGFAAHEAPVRRSVYLPLEGWRQGVVVGFY